MFIGNRLAFDTPKEVNRRVAVLEFLLVLCVFSGGGQVEKAQFLFKLFNVDHTGILKEEEHANFMRTARSVFQKLNLIGILDWNENDIVFLSLQARSFYKSVTNSIEYLPGLKLEEFLRWMYNSDECKTISKFFGILYQLCSVLELLHNQGQNLSDALNDKVAYFNRSDPVPATPYSNFVPSCTKIFPVYRDQSVISLCFQRDCSSTKRVFLKCTKVGSGHFFRSFDCSPADSPFETISVRGLEAHARYQLTVFSGAARYQSVEVATLAKPGGASQHSLCVLPGSVSATEAVEAVETSSLLSCSDFIFTGNVCTIESVVMQLLAYIPGFDASRFSTALSAAVHEAYLSEWESNLSSLFSLCIPMHQPEVGKMVHKQVLCLDAMGPWSSKLESVVRRSVGVDSFRRSFEAIATVHRRFARSVTSPVFHRSHGGVTTVLVGGGRSAVVQAPHSSQLAPLAASPLQLLAYLRRRVEEGGGGGAEHMVIVMQSPRDLMVSGKENQALHEGNKDGGGEVASMLAKPRLTGRHEIGAAVSGYFGIVLIISIHFCHRTRRVQGHK